MIHIGSFRHRCQFRNIFVSSFSILLKHTSTLGSELRSGHVQVILSFFLRDCASCTSNYCQFCYGFVPFYGWLDPVISILIRGNFLLNSIKLQLDRNAIPFISWKAKTPHFGTYCGGRSCDVFA